MLLDWTQYTPPGIFAAGMRLYSGSVRLVAPSAVQRRGLERRRPARGAPLGDSRLVDLFSVGPILEGIGLNVTAWSYQDRMNFTVLSCPDLVPDLGPLIAEFAPALRELTKELA